PRSACATSSPPATSAEGRTRGARPQAPPRAFSPPKGTPMLEDIRNRDPMPTREEREWLIARVWAALERVMLLAGIALVIGTTASWLADYRGESESFEVTSVPAPAR